MQARPALVCLSSSHQIRGHPMMPPAIPPLRQCPVIGKRILPHETIPHNGWSCPMPALSDCLKKFIIVSNYLYFGILLRSKETKPRMDTDKHEFCLSVFISDDPYTSRFIQPDFSEFCGY